MRMSSAHTSGFPWLKKLPSNCRIVQYRNVFRESYSSLVRYKRNTIFIRSYRKLKVDYCRLEEILQGVNRFIPGSQDNPYRQQIIKYNDALIQAVIDELSRKRGYGCVSFDTQGSHRDMDYHTFLMSIHAISDAFLEISWDDIHDFHDLRKAGCDVEKKMFAETEGVNTHKGLTFLQLFLLYAYLHAVEKEHLTPFIKEFSQPLLDDYKRMEDFHSAKYAQVGIKDVRQHPLEGYSQLLQVLDLMKDYRKANRGLSEVDEDDYLTLLLIERFDDTTTIKRSNVTTLRNLQTEAREIVALYDQKDREAAERRAEELDAYYRENYIASGGIADLFTTLRTLEIIWRKP